MAIMFDSSVELRPREVPGDIWDAQFHGHFRNAQMSLKITSEDRQESISNTLSHPVICCYQCIVYNLHCYIMRRSWVDVHSCIKSVAIAYTRDWYRMDGEKFKLKTTVRHISWINVITNVGYPTGADL